jgi:hydroxyethylthiazole kinase-like uncharacterized protein yjeF
MKVLSADQIRKWDAYTIAHEPISSLDLMERAAGKCTGWLLNTFYDTKPVKIFCGKGNNGGDGLAIARQLAEKDIIADVYILEFGALGTDDFQVNLSRLHSYPVRIHFVQSVEFLPAIDENDLLIDCLFGTGLSRPLEGLYAEVVMHINQTIATIVSVDVPSGLFTDKATASDIVIKADFTLTFQLLKLSFLYPENEKYLGEVRVLAIELHSGYLSTVHSIYELTDRSTIKEIYKPRKKFSHKGTFGHALVIAGEKGKMGAAVLCTRACLRAGAGLVTTMIPADEFAILQTAVPEAMAIADREIGSVSWSRYSTIGIGPGIGAMEHGAQLLQAVLGQFNNPIVCDADALNILAANQELLAELPPGSILSPHPKEFERLFGKTDDHFARIQTARYYAQKLFVYIIVKGHYSVLACPDGEVYFNSTGNAGMATAGSGDVLTGILTGLLSQGYSPKDASVLAMYLHGLAGDIAIKSISEEALIAGDLVKFLSKAFLQVKV